MNMANFMDSEIQEQPSLVKQTAQYNEATIEKIVTSVKQRPIHSAFLVARGTSDHIGIYAKISGGILFRDTGMFGCFFNNQFVPAKAGFVYCFDNRDFPVRGGAGCDWRYERK
ncbi:MAG TPA: hypothetical protein VHY08_10600 [Bacillota bacterium]|nr:hypothetical protein [Bacillota bacterium]